MTYQEYVVLDEMLANRITYLTDREKVLDDLLFRNYITIPQHKELWKETDKELREKYCARHNLNIDFHGTAKRG